MSSSEKRQKDSDDEDEIFELFPSQSAFCRDESSVRTSNSLPGFEDDFDPTRRGIQKTYSPSYEGDKDKHDGETVTIFSNEAPTASSSSSNQYLGDEIDASSRFAISLSGDILEDMSIDWTKWNHEPVLDASLDPSRSQTACVGKALQDKSEALVGEQESHLSILHTNFAAPLERSDFLEISTILEDSNADSASTAKRSIVSSIASYDDAASLTSDGLRELKRARSNDSGYPNVPCILFPFPSMTLASSNFFNVYFNAFNGGDISSLKAMVHSYVNRTSLFCKRRPDHGLITQVGSEYIIEHYERINTNFPDSILQIRKVSTIQRGSGYWLRAKFVAGLTMVPDSNKVLGTCGEYKETITEWMDRGVETEESISEVKKLEQEIKCCGTRIQTKMKGVLLIYVNAITNRIDIFETSIRLAGINSADGNEGKS